MSEERWFETYDWNGEASTLRILFIPRTMNQALSNTTEQFMESIGMVPESRHKPEIKGRFSYAGWVLDMSSRKYKRLGAWEITLEKRGGTKVAWPSQVQIHLTEKRGTLVGHQFGI